MSPCSDAPSPRPRVTTLRSPSPDFRPSAADTSRRAAYRYLTIPHGHFGGEHPHPSDTLDDHAMTPTSARRCRLAAIAAGSLLLIDWAATITNVGAGPLNLAFTVLVMAIFPAGYLAVRRAPPQLRRWATLTVASLFIQIVANAIWYVDYLQRHEHFPGFGAWTIVALPRANQRGRGRVDRSPRNLESA